jgi:hypothetical protein
MRRRDERLDLTTKGRLAISGKVYDCIIDNISPVGAAIDMTLTKTPVLQVGQMGTLNVLLLSPVRFHFRVVRTSSTRVGVEFVDFTPQGRAQECAP